MTITDLIKSDVDARERAPREEEERERQREERRQQTVIADATEALRLLAGWHADECDGFERVDPPQIKYINSDHVRFRVEEWTFSVLMNSDNTWTVYAHTIKHERVQREMASPPDEEERKVEIEIHRLADLADLIPDPYAFDCP